LSQKGSRDTFVARVRERGESFQHAYFRKKSSDRQ